MRRTCGKQASVTVPGPHVPCPLSSPHLICKACARPHCPRCPHGSPIHTTRTVHTIHIIHCLHHPHHPHQAYHNLGFKVRREKNHFRFLNQCVPNRLTAVVAPLIEPFPCAGPVSRLFPQFHLPLTLALQAAPNNL